MIEQLQSGVLGSIGIPVIDTVQSRDVKQVLETSVISRPLLVLVSVSVSVSWRTGLGLIPFGLVVSNWSFVRQV